MKIFFESYQDSTKSATHDKSSDEKYDCNIHIIELIIRPALLCAEQKIALQDSSNDAGKNLWY